LVKKSLYYVSALGGGRERGHGLFDRNDTVLAEKRGRETDAFQKGTSARRGTWV